MNYIEVVYWITVKPVERDSNLKVTPKSPVEMMDLVQHISL